MCDDEMFVSTDFEKSFKIIAAHTKIIIWEPDIVIIMPNTVV